MTAKRIFQLCLVLLVLVASFAGTTKAYADSTCGDSYVVQRGDWLAKIARNCGVTLADLRAANMWTYNSQYVYAGQVVVIPGGSSGGYSGGSTGGACGPATDVSGGFYVVCPGDTLASIARYYGVSWVYLQSRNSIPNANLIYSGQIIYP